MKLNKKGKPPLNKLLFFLIICFSEKAFSVKATPSSTNQLDEKVFDSIKKRTTTEEKRENLNTSKFLEPALKISSPDELAEELKNEGSALRKMITLESPIGLEDDDKKAMEATFEFLKKYPTQDAINNDKKLDDAEKIRNEAQLKVNLKQMIKLLKIVAANTLSLAAISSLQEPTNLKEIDAAIESSKQTIAGLTAEQQKANQKQAAAQGENEAAKKTLSEKTSVEENKKKDFLNKANEIKNELKTTKKSQEAETKDAVEKIKTFIGSVQESDLKGNTKNVFAKIKTLAEQENPSPEEIREAFNKNNWLNFEDGNFGKKDGANLFDEETKKLMSDIVEKASQLSISTKNLAIFEGELKDFDATQDTKKLINLDANLKDAGAAFDVAKNETSLAQKESDVKEKVLEKATQEVETTKDLIKLQVDDQTKLEELKTQTEADKKAAKNQPLVANEKLKSKISLENDKITMRILDKNGNPKSIEIGTARKTTAYGYTKLLTGSAVDDEATKQQLDVAQEVLQNSVKTLQEFNDGSNNLNPEDLIQKRATLMVDVEIARAKLICLAKNRDLASFGVGNLEKKLRNALKKEYTKDLIEQSLNELKKIEDVSGKNLDNTLKLADVKLFQNRFELSKNGWLQRTGKKISSMLPAVKNKAKNQVYQKNQIKKLKLAVEQEDDAEKKYNLSKQLSQIATASADKQFEIDKFKWNQKYNNDGKLEAALANIENDEQTLEKLKAELITEMQKPLVAGYNNDTMKYLSTEIKRLEKSINSQLVKRINGKTLRSLRLQSELIKDVEEATKNSVEKKTPNPYQYVMDKGIPQIKDGSRTGMAKWPVWNRLNGVSETQFEGLLKKANFKGPETKSLSSKLKFWKSSTDLLSQANKKMEMNTQYTSASNSKSPGIMTTLKDEFAKLSKTMPKAPVEMKNAEQQTAKSALQDEEKKAKQQDLIKNEEQTRSKTKEEQLTGLNQIQQAFDAEKLLLEESAARNNIQSEAEKGMELLKQQADESLARTKMESEREQARRNLKDLAAEESKAIADEMKSSPAPDPKKPSPAENKLKVDTQTNTDPLPPKRSTLATNIALAKNVKKFINNTKKRVEAKKAKSAKTPGD